MRVMQQIRASNIVQVTPTVSQKVMRQGLLIDVHGVGLEMVFYGSNATIEMQEGDSLVCWNAQAQPGRGPAEHGKLWLYDTSTVDVGAKAVKRTLKYVHHFELD